MKRFALILIAVLMTLNRICFGQGLMVQPMKVDINAKPGVSYRANMELRNIYTTGPISLLLDITDLLQNKDCSLSTGPSVNSSSGTTDENSCAKWIRIENFKPSMEAGTTNNLLVNIDVPSNASGFYKAAITIESNPSGNAQGLAVVFQFVIPVIINVSGPPVRTKLDVVDFGLTYSEKENTRTNQKDKLDTLFVALSNQGKTLSKVAGKAILFKNDKSRWQKVLELELPSKKVFPRNNVEFTVNSPKRIPSGRYKIDTYLIIDEKNIPLKTKEIDYVGNPESFSISEDVVLDIEPNELLIEGAGKTTRTGSVTVNNTSDSDVVLKLTATVPKELISLNVNGSEDLSCNRWVKLVANNIPLRKNSERKIPIQLVFPEMELKSPFYYSTISIEALINNEVAGKNEYILIAKNKDGKINTKVEPVSLTVSQEEGSRYFITAKYINSGSSHIKAKCLYRLSNLTGEITYSKAEFTRQKSIVFPQEVSQWGYTSDFKDIKVGTYVIESDISFNDNKVTQSLPIEVKVNPSGEKVVEIINSSSSVAAGTPSNATDAVQ